MPDIHGSLEGIRNSLINELKTLYDYPIGSDEYLPVGLADLQDGMAKRAQVIMMNEPTSSLDSYFSQNWIARDDGVQDAVNGNGPYRNCSITGFDHRISLSRVWSWPWENYATATVTESIPGIDGRSASGTVPGWPTSKYTITLSKESGTWKIRNITLLERVSNDQ